MLSNIKIRTKIVLSFLVIILIAFAIGYSMVKKVNELVPVTKELLENINQVDSVACLNGLAQTIRYYDEVLAQSARNYAFTGDIKWKTRYLGAEPKLDSIIKEAIEKGTKSDITLFESVDEANISLVALEKQAIASVDKGDKPGAIKILEGQKYQEYKSKYESALIEYANNKGYDYDAIFGIPTTELKKEIEAHGALVIYTSQYIVYGVLAFIGFLISVTFILTYNIRRRLKTLKYAMLRIAKKDYTYRMPENRKDEVGEVSKIFNVMVSRISKSEESIIKKVEKRTEELEKINKALVGRELQMIELKKEIEKLKNKK